MFYSLFSGKSLVSKSPDEMEAS